MGPERCAARGSTFHPGDRLSPKPPGLGFHWKGELISSRFRYREGRDGGSPLSTSVFFPSSFWLVF